jgi:hypothetical protein
MFSLSSKQNATKPLGLGGKKVLILESGRWESNPQQQLGRL